MVTFCVCSKIIDRLANFHDFGNEEEGLGPDDAAFKSSTQHPGKWRQAPLPWFWPNSEVSGFLVTERLRPVRLLRLLIITLLLRSGINPNPGP